MPLINRPPPVEYAAMGQRYDAIAVRSEISAVQRERLLALRDLEIDGHLAAWERRELDLLERLQGVRGPELSVSELAELQQLMAETTLAQLGQLHPTQRSRSRMTPQQRMVQLYEMRWPRKRLSGRQAIVALWEQRIMWDMTPKQRRVYEMRPRR